MLLQGFARMRQQEFHPVSATLMQILRDFVKGQLNVVFNGPDARQFKNLVRLALDKQPTARHN